MSLSIWFSNYVSLVKTVMGVRILLKSGRMFRKDLLRGISFILHFICKHSPTECHDNILYYVKLTCDNVNMNLIETHYFI
jgi:hypothetical protein